MSLEGCDLCGRPYSNCECHPQPRAPTVDMVNHPPHYAEAHPEGIECIQVTRYMNFNLGNAVKYIWRTGKKSADEHITDLKKARWYIDDEIRRLEGTLSSPVEAKRKSA